MTNKSNKIRYSLDEQGSFVIENYNHAKPFSNFFPGIAGVWGIPMWVFYVNRGQGISSFGIEGKDKAILEFQPANKAYRLTSLQGFRTFIKVKSANRFIFWEPFQSQIGINKFQTTQRMIVTSHDLTIEDVNKTLGIAIRVNYFTLPEEPLAALIRRVTVVNLSNSAKNIEIIDGLPVILPYGLRDWLAKHMSRTVEAWVKVRNVDKKTPYYHLNVEVSDTPQVKHIEEGNFYISFEETSRQPKLLDPIVEAACVFGDALDFLAPEKFLSSGRFRVPKGQQTSNRTPSAMTYHGFNLKRREERRITSIIGFAYHQSEVHKLVERLNEKDFIETKSIRNKAITDGIKHYALTKSSSTKFDLYCQQTFLDNVLRGGLPISLGTQEGHVTFNVYSRKHGDLERDYNHFVLSPTYFSQGNGNYRDVNQNRRNDIWFNSHVGDSNILNFLNLIQADGYNPLIVKGTTFTLDKSYRSQQVLADLVKEDKHHRLQGVLKGGFQLGQLMNAVIHDEVKLKVPVQEFLARIVGLCHAQESADAGEGFWTDHWTYNTDLLECFASVCPEKFYSLFLREKTFIFYHNNHYVLPRSERFILRAQTVRQYHSVGHDSKITKADERGNKLHTKNGEGDVYTTHLLGKLLCVLANKVATLDPSGVGLEMEADKPNWYDALNGLPGLLGSSVSETFELKRLAQVVLNTLKELNLKEDSKVLIFAELFSFITRIIHLLGAEKDPFSYWNWANEAKEHYRYRVRSGIDGQEEGLTIAEIKKFLNLIIQRTDEAVARARVANRLYATYFYHEVVEFEKSEKAHHSGSTFVKPTKFKQHTLPLFLEGFVHALRTMTNPKEARALYQKVRQSPLFDAKLKMYKVNADLTDQSEEIGRTRIFPRGWLENESVWMHMEYKFILELLRAGLYEEFYENFKNVLVPFLKPEIYGRSPLENSSFIASSAHEDKNLHGQGFVARLSGSTAEFLHMWLLMNVGPRPFGLDKSGKLVLNLQPALPAWLFTRKSSKLEFVNAKGDVQVIEIPKDSYAFNVLGSTVVVYHNPKRKNTFGSGKAIIVKIVLTYPNRKDPVTINSSTISSPYAEEIREHKLSRIDVYLE